MDRGKIITWGKIFIVSVISMSISSVNPVTVKLLEPVTQRTMSTSPVKTPVITVHLVLLYR